MKTLNIVNIFAVLLILSGNIQNGASTRSFSSFFSFRETVSKKLDVREAREISRTLQLMTSQDDFSLSLGSLAADKVFIGNEWGVAESTQRLHFESVEENYDQDRALRGGESQKCLSDLARMGEALQSGQTWALNMVDSWGKPGPSILEGWFSWAGNYDQCRDVTAPPDKDTDGDTLDGNYCVVMLSPNNIPLMVQLGTCMPDTCSEENITQIMAQALLQYNVTSLRVSSTECRDDDRDFSTASVLATVVLSIIVILMVAGTAYDIAYIQMPKWREDEAKSLLGAPTAQLADGATQPQGTGDIERQKGAGLVVDTNEKTSLLGALRPSNPSKFGGAVHNTLLAFSIYSNASKVLSTREPKGAISCINGIRFFSMTWVVLLHLWMEIGTFALNLPRGMGDRTDEHLYSPVFNGTFCVDTFFTLSGFLVSYLKSREIMKKGLTIKWRLFYFHRIWRLTPPYMLYLLFFLGLTRFMGSGAVWSNTQPLDKENCEDNWWTNLLYINNFVKWDQLCMLQSWYLANDMQFYLVSPLLFVPFYFNKFVGLAVCLGALVASWTTIIVLTVINDWVLADSAGNTGDRLHHYYFAPYCRICPFIIGILAGYLLAAKGGKIEMKKWMVGLGWPLAITVGILIVYGVHDDVTNEDPSSTGVAALYLAFARSAWAMAICWVILSCHSGYGGPINVFLSWKPFLVLGKLSYTCYLIHTRVIEIYFANIEQPFLISDFGASYLYMAVVFITCMCSFALVIAVEMPMIGLEKVILGSH